ncbi:uncharacterized protein LOC127109679 [Lathyrus oleraceus]|uniref:uncharacterized protein LOC127109679 n=1 Tax=Pisum sativum TaxID=3888 RepID=UPI0021CEBD3B|nr:uncharacterized protein LOC127109679 [Pisum sativum]
MDHLEQENRELLEEVNTLRDNFERLTAMMETLADAQNQPPPPPPQTPLKRYQPAVEVPVAQPVMSIPPPMVHVTPYVEEPIFHVDQSETFDSCCFEVVHGIDSTYIRTFNDLGEAFVRQCKYNVEMAPDRDQFHAMSQKDKETFKEYAQRWNEISAQVGPPLEEKEMTKLFLKKLSLFYYDRMVTGSPSDFTEMLNMGIRLEEGVSEGRLKESGSSDSSKRYGNGLPKKKEHNANAIS